MGFLHEGLDFRHNCNNNNNHTELMVVKNVHHAVEVGSWPSKLFTNVFFLKPGDARISNSSTGRFKQPKWLSPCRVCKGLRILESAEPSLKITCRETGEDPCLIFQELVD